MKAKKMVVEFVKEAEEQEKISIVRHSVICEGTLTYGGKKGIDSIPSAVLLAEQIFQNSDREMCLCCSLNSRKVIQTIEVVSIGTVNTCVIGIAEAFKTAIVSNATGILLFHNHPSGICQPSKEDIELTGKFYRAGKFLDIQLVDHIICGGNGKYYSFKENGTIEGDTKRCFPFSI